MINRYFAFATTQAHVRRGPLGPYIDGFAKLITEQGFQIQSVRSKLRFVADLSAWLDRKQLHVQRLDEEQAEAFLKTQKQQYVGPRGHRQTIKLTISANWVLSPARIKRLLPIHWIESREITLNFSWSSEV